jgi:hypothetical protein
MGIQMFKSSNLAVVIFTLCGLLGVPALGVAQGTTQVPVEATWPTTITEGNVTATIYEPQPTSWPGRTTVNATAAMMITKAGVKPIVGTLDIAAATQTDFTGRWVTFSNIRVLATHFPMLDTDQAAKVQARITAIAAKLGGRRVPLDTLLLALDRAPAETKPVETNNTPPVIFHSTLPAILVVTDGAPVLAPISGTGLSFAVNTNWSLFQKTATGEWYLLDGKTWLSAPAFTGPYQPAGVLPADFSKLPNNASFTDVKKYVPNGPAPNPAPTVFVSTKPAQIIVTNGPAQLTPVAGAPLKYVSNSSTEVIFDPSSNTYYVLFSGRWFSAPSLEGSWVYATPNLPPTFALIPADGPHGALLASVPGTAHAQQAVISAQIPRQATLPRTTTTEVVYVGAPNFVPIAGTTLSYAVNTYSQVVEVNGTYFACNNGAWFVSNTPTGPWVLAASVPQAIYTIPPSSPLYPVTYVHVYSATPTAIVTGYTAGYTMGLITAAGVVLYGTGYYYPPVVIARAVPVYLPYPYPYPYTYGGGIRYVSSTGAWVSGGAVYGPYSGVAARSVYNPATGAYAHGNAVWGPNGGSAYGSFSNPSTGRYGSTSQSWNPYGRSGSSTFSGPNQTVHTQSGSNANGSAGGFRSSNGAYGGGVYNKSNGNTTAAGKAANGDVYAGHNGNVYQHSDSGWSKYDSSSGGFKPVTQPSNFNRTTNGASQAAPGQMRQSAQSANRPAGGSDNFGQLNNDRNARQGGWQRQSGGARQFGGGQFGGGGGGGRRR